MLLEQNSNAFKIINDFSRKLFLIQTPSDFHSSLKDAFHSVIPNIELYIFFRFNWEDESFSIISSNYLNDINNIELDRSELDRLLTSFIQKDQTIYNPDLSKKRKGEFIPLLNTSSTGSEAIFPLTPVNDAVGILYTYSRSVSYFDGETLETMKLIGNMTSRTWNIIKYQAQQIKSHKKAELEVIHQKNLMYAIFDYLPINVFTKDENGKYIYLNKNAEAFIGKNADEVIGKTVNSIYAESTAKQLREDDLEVHRTKKPMIKQYEINTKFGKKHVFIGKKLITTSENKELLIGFSIDISQNIQVSQAIEDQKKFYQLIFNTVPNYIYVKDIRGNYLMANDAFSDLFALSREEILQLGIPDRFQINRELNDAMDQRVFEFGKSVEYEESIIFESGEEKWFHTTKKPLSGKDGVINLLGISIDITDRKKHSDELLKAKQTKEQFLANMSHEIRTPINGIIGMLNLLEDIPASKEQKKYLHAIKTSSKNLQVIINDILDLSAIESGNIKFERIGFNLKAFFNTLISSFSYAARQKGLTITLNFDPYIDEVVIGDPVRLNQVVSNLIGNALKFTRRGFIKVYALKIHEENGWAHFQFIVDDSGIGIPADKLEKIFENFEQGDAAVNRKYGGTGLGLAIVKQLVESQRGTIKVESTPGRGSKFTVDLEFRIGTEKDLDEVKSPSRSIESSRTRLDLSRHKILLVEDNEVNLLYTRKILQNWNGSPHVAKNGLIALEMLKENDYDLILMDVRMPIMDGFEATKFIRSNFNSPKSDTPIVALTANAIKGDDEKCIAAGMNDYISKPFEPETLKNKIISNMDLEGFTRQVLERPASEADLNRVVDLSYLRDMSDNDIGFITDMVSSFVTQAPKDIEHIWHHFSNNQLDEVANLIHKIKPSITFMGIHKLKELALEIEDNARQKRMGVLKEQLEKFDRTCKLAVKELKEEFTSMA